MTDSSADTLPGRAPWPEPKVRCGPQVGAGLFQALRDEVQPLAQVSGFPEQLLLNWVWPWEASSPNPCGRAAPGVGRPQGALGEAGRRSDPHLALGTEGLASSV